MQMTTELSCAIENLYSAFEAYPLRSDTGPCPCCHGPEDERALHHRPLRELSAKELQTYTFSALYTWGDENDFRHFLPRIFELLVIDSAALGNIDPEAIFRKLPYASWQLWPKAERDAITSFVRAAWSAALRTVADDPNAGEIVEWLCSIAQFEDDLSPYLDQWLADSSKAASWNLARVILNEIPFSDERPPVYWQERQKQWEQFLGWVQTPAVREKLEQGVERWADDIAADELFEAASLLQ